MASIHERASLFIFMIIPFNVSGYEQKTAPDQLWHTGVTINYMH